MSQKYKRFVLSNKELCLADESSKTAIGEQIENVCVSGHIKTIHKLLNLCDVIEPNRAEILAQTISSAVGEICNLFVYQRSIGTLTYEYLILCAAQNYTLYYYELNASNPALKVFNSITLSSKPIFQTYIAGGENVLLISSPTDALWTWNGVDEPVEILDSPKVTSMAVNIDRLFVTDSSLPYSVAYSENRDPTTWAMSTGDIATIDFSDDLGRVIKVVALDNYIFVIRQFGLIKIYSGKDSDNFSISKMYFSNGKINSNTVCQMGDYLVFASTDGIYVFDGLNTKKICAELDSKINYETAFAVSQNGIYYLFSDDSGADKNVVYFVDIKSAKVYEALTCSKFKFCFAIVADGLNCVGFVECNTDSENAKLPVIIVKNNNLNAYAGNFLYKTKLINLEPEGKIKSIRKLSAITKTDICVDAITENETKSFYLNASDKLQTRLILLNCCEFQLKIHGESGADIWSISLDYSYQEGM